MLLKSGLRQGSKEIFQELNNSVKWFADDSKNIFNKVEKDPTKHENISVEEKLCENILDEKIENKWENECEGILFYAKTMHERLKDNWQQEYLAASTNRKIMSKIDYFLKNMNQIKMSNNFFALLVSLSTSVSLP